MIHTPFLNVFYKDEAIRQSRCWQESGWGATRGEISGNRLYDLDRHRS